MAARSCAINLAEIILAHKSELALRGVHFCRQKFCNFIIFLTSWSRSSFSTLFHVFQLYSVEPKGCVLDVFQFDFHGISRTGCESAEC
jgi:hypothetical protein